ncbi:putative long-chain-alcohol O-fatty-acyltransferase 8 [Tetrabaena socialis]|uniref:Putative long-chain-alcohol O-fatty-acyltransferase 8 n=1 Tax=Tetrabaena socialis TaxID=47790 RepID=A0A2J8AD49_9CHLO|nr:putative long-chain-alcohol O-fatty-acyltransferase 8 [Tetrabaena socialis]|eukprot:PNH10445.1 putative long-chain-alcohol O-fatty-acyltransferase 8 [Tetrabaena socialis]
MQGAAALAGGTLALCLYVAEVAKRSRPGALRTTALLPSAFGFFTLPLLALDGREDPFLMQAAVCILSMSAFKVLALCGGRGSLADPNLGDVWAFIGVLAFPVVPVGPQTHGTEKRRAAAVLKLRTAALKLAFFVLLAATCLTSLHYVDRLATAPAAAAGVVALTLATWRVLCYFMAGVALLFEVDGMGDVVDAAALSLFGITSEPHFDRVWMATSFTDLWARRWNLTVSSVLRYAFYEPIVDGRWLVADPRATVPLGAAGPPARPHRPHRSGAAAPAASPRTDSPSRPPHLTLPAYGPSTAVAAGTSPAPTEPPTPFYTAEKAPTLATWLAPGAGGGGAAGGGGGSGGGAGPELGITPSASSSCLVSESDGASPASSAYGRDSASSASTASSTSTSRSARASASGGDAPADASSASSRREAAAEAGGAAPPLPRDASEVPQEGSGLRRRREGASGFGAGAAVEADGNSGNGDGEAPGDGAMAAAGAVKGAAQQGQQQGQQEQQLGQQVEEVAQELAAPPRVRPSRGRRFLGTLITFFVSGLWHELVCYSMTGATTRGYWTLLFSMQAPILMLEGELKRVVRPAGVRVPPVLARFITHGIFLLELTLLWYPPMVSTGMLASMIRKGDEMTASLAGAAQLVRRYMLAGGSGAW